MSASGRPRDARDRSAVLVLESDDLVHRLVPPLLQLSGYTVRSARDVADALAVIGDAAAHVTVVVVDASSEDVGTLLAQVQASYPHVHVIMTGHQGDDAPPGDRTAVTRLGRPFTPTGLLAAVEQAIGRA